MGQTEGRKARSALERDPKVIEILAAIAEKPEVRNLDLKSYLIKPVQRICKYPLLLRELQKSQKDPIAPRDSPIYIRLEVARQAMAEILESTNDQMIISEGRLTTVKLEDELNSVFGDDTSKLELSLSRRQFVCSDTLMVGTRTNRKRKKPERIRLELFSDLLLLLAPLEGDASELFYVKHVFPLSALTLTNIGDGALPEMADVNDVWELQLRDAEERYTVCSPSAAVKEKWLVSIGVGAAFQERGDALISSASSSSGSIAAVEPRKSEPVIRVLQDVSTPDDVVQWLRAEPERKRAQELAKKGIDKLAPSDRKLWESLHEKARSQKRETLRVGSSLDLEQMEAEESQQKQKQQQQQQQPPPPLPPQPSPTSEPAAQSVAVARFASPAASPRRPVSPAARRGAGGALRGTAAAQQTAEDEEEGGEFIVFSTAVSPRK